MQRSISVFSSLGAYSIDEISDLIRKRGFINVRELDIPREAHSILLVEKP